MSVVRCGNRECKKYLQKSDAVSNGFSHFCDRDCMLSQQKATQPRKKASQATKAGAVAIPAKTRLRVLERDLEACRLCFGGWRLEIHHINYRSNYANKKWENEPWNLILLCQQCHDKVHNNKKFWMHRLLGLTWLSEVCNMNYTVEQLENEYGREHGWYPDDPDEGS